MKSAIERCKQCGRVICDCGLIELWNDECQQAPAAVIEGVKYLCLNEDVLQRISAALSSATPAVEGLTDEREAFKRHIQATEQREPLLWSQVWANSMREDPLPDHFAGKYFINADQKAWDAWEARAALAASPVPMSDTRIFEQIRREALRYRWLARKVSAHGVIDGWAFGFPTHLTLPAPVRAMHDPEAALGEAIDAAIAAAPQKGDK